MMILSREYGKRWQRASGDWRVKVIQAETVVEEITGERCRTTETAGKCGEAADRLEWNEVSEGEYLEGSRMLRHHRLFGGFWRSRYQCNHTQTLRLKGL